MNGIKGIWYDATRNRYRVRLYHKGKVCYREYRSSYELALSAYYEGKARQSKIARSKPKAESFLDNLVKGMLKNDCQPCTDS